MTFWVIASYFLGGIVAYVLARPSRKIGAFVALLFSIYPLYALIPALDGGFYLRFTVIPYYLHLSFRLTLLGWFFALIAATLCSLSLFSAYSEKRGSFFLLSSMFSAGGLMGVFLAADYLTLFIFFEIMAFFSAFTFIREHRRSALKYIIYSLVGSYAFLAALLVINRSTGSLEITPLSGFGGSVPAVMSLFILAFWVKSAVMPFHPWAPSAYADSPHSYTPFFSGALSKSGVYGLVLAFFYIFAGFFKSHHAFGYIFAWIGALTALFAGIYALLQDDAKKLLAYSSISQLGYVAFGLGLGTSLSITGSLFVALGHAVFESLLFFVIAAVYIRTGTTMLTEMGGLIKKMPISFIALLFGIIAAAGIPPTVGFPGKWMLYEAVLEKSYPLLAGVIFAASITAFLYCYRLIYSIFLGPLKKEFRDVREAPFPALVPLLLLLIPLLFFGLFPGYVVDVTDSILREFGYLGVPHTPAKLLSGLGTFNGLAVGITMGAAFVIAFLVHAVFSRSRKVSELNNYTAGEVAEGVSMHYVADFYKFIERELHGFLKLRVEALFNWIAEGIGGLGEVLRRVYAGDIQAYLVYLILFLGFLFTLYRGVLRW